MVVLAGSPNRGEPRLRWVAWRRDRRSASSSPRAERGSRPPTSGCPTTAAAACRGCAARRSPSWPASASPYYTRLERGDMSGASEGVLEALARALQLDDAERAHLFDLARAAQPSAAPPRRRQAKQPHPAGHPVDPRRHHRRRRVRRQRPPRHPRHQRARPRAVLRAVRRPGPARQPRPVRLSRSARRGVLRRLGSRRPRDRRDPALGRGPRPPRPRPQQTSSASSRPRAMPSAPTGPLTTSASTPRPSSTSTTPWWASSSLSFNRLDIAADHGLTLFTYAAEPGSRSAEALALLGSWAATSDQAESAAGTA